MRTSFEGRREIEGKVEGVRSSIYLISAGSPSEAKDVFENLRMMLCYYVAEQT
jgi:hypothetical protein